MERQLDEQFDFTTSGVVQYNAWLNGLFPAERTMEALLAAGGVVEFLDIRFILTEEQLEYAENLEADTAFLWSQQLAYAIEHQLPIELVKPAQSIRASTKYIRSESATSTETTPGARTVGDYLRFIISETPDSP